MTALKSANNENNIIDENLFKNYQIFHNNFYLEIQKAVRYFFQKDFNVRFMGISIDENVLFYGDEYFVNKIPIVKHSDFIVKISSNLVSNFLDNALGKDDKEFNLNNLTDIEAMLIKSFTVYLYKKLEKNFNRIEVNKRMIQKGKNYNLTFYVGDENKHAGKFIIIFPDYIMREFDLIPKQEVFTIEDYANSQIKVNISAGKSKIALNEIKTLEEGDLIILEDSNINLMSVVHNNKEYSFKINPNPELIISVNNNGGSQMEDETSTKSQNMWDSILVDIVAEFDNVKMTLGELKQISEGLVIDLGSVYENKIKLRVENQVVATGELVILNDRYGVRIDNVKKARESVETEQLKNKQEIKKEDKPQEIKKETVKQASESAKAQPKNNKQKEDDENFDYSDFEIEDESI